MPVLIKITSTSDISLASLETLKRTFNDNGFEVEVSDRQVKFKSFDPPSWVSFIAEANIWLQILAYFAAVYLTSFIKEAGKDTWKGISKAISSKIENANRVKIISKEVYEFRKTLSSKSKIQIKTFTANESPYVCLELIGSNSEEIELEIALFLHHLPELAKFIHEESLSNEKVVGEIKAEILSEGSLRVTWQNRVTLEDQTKTIPLSVD